jgi:hypothetical protein
LKRRSSWANAIGLPTQFIESASFSQQEIDELSEILTVQKKRRVLVATSSAEATR